MKKRILATGCSGKLGQACVKHLVATGYDVLVVDKTKFPDAGIHTLIVDLANDTFIIANEDTVSNIPSAELADRFSQAYP